MAGIRDVHIAAVRDAILEYVQTHPEAADTALGIVRWWLPQDMGEGAVQVIDAVLDDLVRTGMMWRVQLPDGALLFAARDGSATGTP